MFKNTYQSGFLTIFYAGGARPLSIWGQKVRNGHIRRVTDEDVQTLALEIMGTNVVTTYIVCPAEPRRRLGIRLPFFVMIVKNMKKYFTFEITILDDKNMSRRFRVSNYQSTTRVRPFSTSLPIGLTGGWNQIQFNLADFTRRAYGSSYLETLRVQIHANIRIRRIYFADRLYSEDEMPHEFKLYVPVGKQKGKGAPKEEPVKVEDKATGADKIRKSVEIPEGEGLEQVPSGAPPTPTESAPADRPPEEEELAQAGDADAGDDGGDDDIEEDVDRDYDEEAGEVSHRHMEMTGELETTLEPVPEENEDDLSPRENAEDQGDAERDVAPKEHEPATAE